MLQFAGRGNVHKQDADWWTKESASECSSAQWECVQLAESPCRRRQPNGDCLHRPLYRAPEKESRSKRRSREGEGALSPFFCPSPRTTSSPSIYISLFLCPISSSHSSSWKGEDKGESGSAHLGTTSTALSEASLCARLPLQLSQVACKSSQKRPSWRDLSCHLHNAYHLHTLSTLLRNTYYCN